MKIIVASALGLLLGSLYFGWKAADDADTNKWEKVVELRKREVITRHILPLQNMLQQETGILMQGTAESLRLGYAPTIDGFTSNNRMMTSGLITFANRRVGSWQTEYFFVDSATEPASAKIALTLEPQLLSHLKRGEFAYLVEQTRKAGEVRTKFSGMEWYSRFESKGNLDLVLRLTYPALWMEQPTPTDHSAKGTANLLLNAAPKMLSFLRKEALVDGWSVYLNPPHFNPPHLKSGLGSLGVASGFIVAPDGRTLNLEINTSSTIERIPQYSVNARINAPEGDRWSEADVRKVFKSKLIEVVENGRTGDFQLGGSLKPEYMSVNLDFPIDYDIHKAKL